MWAKIGCWEYIQIFSSIYIIWMSINEFGGSWGGLSKGFCFILIKVHVCQDGTSQTYWDQKLAIYVENYCKLSMSIKYLLWHFGDTQSMTLGVLKSSRTTCTFPATQLMWKVCCLFTYKMVMCTCNLTGILSGYQHDPSLCLSKIYNLFWIGDIKTHSMDIAFLP